MQKAHGEKIRKAIKQQLQYVRRDFGYVEWMLGEGAELSARRCQRYEVLRAVYKQQKYMYENKVHTAPNRIVSISQPYIRLIVRGKVAAPVEFGAKLDLARHSPFRSFARQTEENALVDKKTEYIDSADRIEVERFFSLVKRCYGLGRIMTKLNVTTRCPYW